MKISDFKKVESIKDLIKAIEEDNCNDFFIHLGFGLKSSKEITYNKEDNGYRFFILNYIDDTEEEMTEHELKASNIGKAIESGNFYREF